MHALFVHSHKFRLIDGEYYTPECFSDEVLTRYTDAFGSVTVAARIITTNESSKSLRKIENKDVNIIDYREIKDFNKFICGFDCVIARMPSSSAIFAAKYARKENIPYIIECVGCGFDALWNHSIKGKLVAPFMWFYMRNSIKKAHFVSYVSEHFLQRRYPTKGKTLSCSNVIIDDISDDVLNQRLHRFESKKKTDKVVLCTIGEVNMRYKGQQYVIRALSDLKQDGYDIEYRLIGGGDSTYLKNVAEKYGVSDNVTFVGQLSREGVFAELDNADIYVHPSSAEGLPRALIEAMSRACPAIGSTAGGIPELIGEKYVFKKKNISDLKNVLKKIIKEDMSIIAQKNFEHAKKYQRKVLDNKRQVFFRCLAKNIKTSAL